MKKRKWLATLRKLNGLTQHQIAKKAYLDRSYYAQIENGIKHPSTEIAKKLAEVLGFHYSIFELEASPFSVALENSPMIIAHCDKEVRYTWIFNPHQDFDMAASIGKTDTEIRDNEGTRALEEMKREVIATEQTMRKEIAFPMAVGKVSYDVFCHPLYNENNELIGAASASTAIHVPTEN
ncbi:helix-turn-helix domain-containing protein [Salimicrobium halophilum]|uniref:Transcriptional regulator, contains XRE-family HTH domain n=1 Tax=Salimicrobium halophilum TaxID=86666 RepID=A0A1G8WP51_9BACI|nr:helix-turn-helix domain-containing protein [Salimicrobium halophilum]SDJ80044.1 Transcriptional regulator, contains XRE-family HTH domain [Salimicrobium halophilum]